MLQVFILGRVRERERDVGSDKGRGNKKPRQILVQQNLVVPRARPGMEQTAASSMWNMLLVANGRTSDTGGGVVKALEYLL